MIKKFGIDISKWQGDFDMAKAKEEGIEFVVMKCGGGDAGLYKDRQFENNYKKSRDLNLDTGIYWFSKALTEDDAIREAEYCYNIIKDKKFELPLYIDVENKQQLAIGKEKLTKVIDVFCRYMEERKIFVGIYSSESYFKTYMNDDELSKYAHWIAAWRTRQPEGCGMWQFGGEVNKLRSNKITGITVDQDYLFYDYKTIITTKGFNGYGKVVDTNRKTNEELAIEVLDGVWGDGVERRERLEAAGYSYTDVQNIVNEKIKYYDNRKYDINSIDNAINKVIIEALNNINVDSSFEHRLKIAERNNIKNYTSKAEENIQLLKLLAEGKLLKA